MKRQPPERWSQWAGKGLALAVLLGWGTAHAATLWFTNSAPILIPSIGAGSPYPSVIELSGVPGTISQVQVALDGLEHSYPDDLDILLVNSHTNVLLMSDRGGGNAITNVNLVFDDLAAGLVPDSTQITSGTYKPSNDGSLDYFISPAPYPPHGAQLALFAGDSPNGAWSLYVLDDTSDDAGALTRGWRLGLTITNFTSSGSPDDADLSVSLVDSPDPAFTEQPLTFQLTVFNSGPAAATGVLVTNTLPAGVEVLSAASSQGSCTNSGGVVVANIGSLSAGALATVTVQVIPHAIGTLSTTATVSAVPGDPFTLNNTATASTLVALGPPALAVQDLAVTETSTSVTDAVFTVTLSRPADETVTVNYATADGTASASSDYYAASGMLSFPPGITNLTVAVEVLGDQVVEPDEDFFLNLSGAVNAVLGRPQARATILNDDGLPGRADHFQWSAISPSQYQYGPFPVTLTALDAAGNPAIGFTNTVSLLGMTGAGTNTVRLLLTELDMSSDGIELANETAFPLDLTGWRVYFYDWTTWPDPCETFDFPSGSVAPPGGVMTIRDTGTPPGSYPSFVATVNLAWSNETTNNQVAVLLVNPAGQPADFFCAVYADPSEIAKPIPISASQWSGGPAIPNTLSSLTYQRSGSADHNDASDWQIAANTMGYTNTGLAVPFAGPRPVSVSPALSGRFVAGVWSGTVTVTESVTNMYVMAQDNDGHAGAGGWFGVLVNHRPVAASPTLRRFAPVGAKLLLSNLLGSDPDGDTISFESLAAASAHGVPLSQDGVWAYYTPAGSFPDPDSFTYVIHDTHGATNIGTVTVSVQTDTNTTPSLSVEDQGDGSFLVRFSGIPGASYTVEATASLQTPDWQPVGSAAADGSGIVNFLDTPPGGTPRYYQAAPSGP